MASYDFTLAAGGVQQIDVIGDFVLVKSSTGLVEVRTDAGFAEVFQAGQGWEQFPFNRLYVSDKSGAANRGTLSVWKSHMGEQNPDLSTWHPRFIDNRVTGNVSIIDAAKDRVASNLCFIAWYPIAALAANFSSVQLWNPVGNTKNLVLEQLVVASSTATGYLIRMGAPIGGTLAGTGLSKRFAGAVASSAEVRTFTNTTALGSVAFLLNGAINTSMTWRPVEPIVIPPGFGASVQGQQFNQDVSASWEWFEDPI